MQLPRGFRRCSIAVDPRLRLDGRWSVKSMRILAVMVLTLTLVGGTGDRAKQGMNSPQGSIGSQFSASSSE
jgi:hypothetical protein